MSGRVHAEAQAAPKSSFAHVRTGLLQRSSTNQAQSVAAPAAANSVHRSPIQSLDHGKRSFTEPRFGHNFSRVSIGIQTKLTINQPCDTLEQEADRIAAAVVDGEASVPQPTGARAYPRSLQRKPSSDAEKYKEGAKKVGEAFLKTNVGNDLKGQATKLGKDFLTTLPGKIIAGTAAAGVIAAIAATNSELPMQVPEIPLDALAPGLKMKLTYEGPVQKPTKAFISFTYEFGGSRTKKPTMTAAEKYRAETARMAAEQAKFREGMKSPEERAADEAAFQEAFWSTKTRYGLEPIEIPGLTPKREDKSLMRKEADSSRSAGGVPPIVNEALRSSGQALAPETRAFMESRFGHDFSQVRVHTGAVAEQSAQDINAIAYTMGHAIVFGAGRFVPGTHEGRRLIAHELTHVIQQSFSGAHALQRDEQKQGTGSGARVDIALVLDDDPKAMIEARTYASTVFRATSGADAKRQILALNKPIGTIFVVSHSNRSGEAQVISKIGTISWVKLSYFSKDLKGLPSNIAPQNIDFRGCKLGEAPGEMETFRKNVGAQSARATNCWSMVKTSGALTLPDGTPITQKSQIKGKEKKFDAALRKQISGLKTANGRSVKNCIIGLVAGETADFNKIKNLYFRNKGNLAAGWASPEYNENWQKGSICVKDLTATTSPCKIVTQTAPAVGGGTKKGAMLLEPVEPSPADDLLGASEKEVVA